ncbi:NFAT activation molecule 1 isoform X2 [Rana temporaria]|uniref:NFAT activation molecule 1 isoform X2 n=1 Tax=Rana temporaria TaxID=8407 RepID=UPI001AAC5DE6|nr:NFAT activation molecule 1 isoform X2 [Rana temporaria]
MDRPLSTIVFIVTWAHLCRACIIDQTPSLLVALSGDWSAIRCTARIVPPAAHQVIITSIFLSWEDQMDRREDVLTNITDMKTIEHRVQARVSGTYKCRLTCGIEIIDAKGTYIHVRESGYQEPAAPVDSLQSGLIALFVLLFLISISGTYLVLPFHRMKQLSSVPAAPQATPTPTAPQQPEEATSGSLYTSLQPHSDDVYYVLDEDLARKTNVKLQAEVHGVPGQSPMKRPKPQAKSSSVQEKPQTLPDKPPIKQKPRKVTAESSVYENIQR